MDTQPVKVVDGKRYNQYHQVIIDCKFCNRGTTAVGTKMCDCCYELYSRIRGDYDLAKKIMQQVKQERGLQ